MCNHSEVTDVDFTEVNVLLWFLIDGVFFVVIVSGNLVTLYVLKSSLQFTPLLSSQFNFCTLLKVFFVVIVSGNLVTLYVLKSSLQFTPLLSSQFNFCALLKVFFVVIVSGNLVTLYVLKSSLQFTPLLSSQFNFCALLKVFFMVIVSGNLVTLYVLKSSLQFTPLLSSQFNFCALLKVFFVVIVSGNLVTLYVLKSSLQFTPLLSSQFNFCALLKVFFVVIVSGNLVTLYVLKSSLQFTPLLSSQFNFCALLKVFFVVIVSGNLVTLYVLKSSLQFTPLISSQFVMSLALSDLIVGLTMPYHMAMIFTPQMANSRLTCVLKFVFILFGCCASILNMTAIAVDRYFAILHPFTYERMMSSRMATTVLCCGWLHAVVFSTVPLYWNSWRPGQPCELGRILPRYYTTAIITPAFLTIWATVLAIYWRILRQAVQQAHKLRQQHIYHLRQSCFQVVLLIMGCFTFCWLPFLVAACIQAAGFPDLISPTMYKIVLTLAISSSAVNPIVYAWKNSEFKHTFGHMVRCRAASHSLQSERSHTDKHRNSPTLLSSPRFTKDGPLLYELQSL